MADSNSLDSLISQNQPVKLATIDINVSVLPGHDMVVNHVDGSQEVAQGHIALEVMKQEAENGGQVVSPAEVVAQSSESPRSNDPEVNGPDNQGQAAGQTADAVVAVVNGDASEKPEAENASEDAGEAAEEPAQPTSADVQGV